MSNEDEEYERTGDALNSDSEKTLKDVKEEAENGYRIQPSPTQFHQKRVVIYTNSFSYKIYHMENMEEFEKVKREYGDEE